VSIRVSFVASLWDHGYGGSLLRRVEIFLDGIISLANRHQLDAEVILVEWNPPAGEPALREMLRAREALGRVTVRIIVVPPELHRTLPNAAEIPFFEPIGKNVGMRRARGEYWLATNPDLLYSDAVFRFLATGLAPGHLYRMDRHDVGEDVPRNLPVKRQLRFCARHIEGVHTGYASIAFPEQVKVGRFRPTPELQKQVELECQNGEGSQPADISYQAQELYRRDGIHTNASGCFLLMHRSHWEAMHGHPEFYTRGHADSVTVWAALTQGLSQVVLRPPCFLFHQPHSRGQQRNWQQTDWRSWYQRFQESKAAGRPLIINGPNWGFAEESFEEWVLQPETTPNRQPRWEKALQSMPRHGTTA